MGRAARHEESKVEFLAAAADAIAHRGFHGMSMRELAKAMGRSLAGFYTYFDSKEEVLFAIQTRAFETLTASAQKTLEHLDDRCERLFGFILQHLRYVVSHHSVMQVLVQEAGALSDEKRTRIRQLKEGYYQLGQNLIQDVMRHGCSHHPESTDLPINEAELERITYSVFGMLNWTYGWYQPDRHGDAPALARSIYHLVLCGISANCVQPQALTQIEKKICNTDITPLLQSDSGAMGIP
jgi:AcrR family transcriptional regulator